MAILIKNGQVVNEGKIEQQDILVDQQRIVKIAGEISADQLPGIRPKVIDAAGQYVLPGMIDDQVHFREPGLTHKGDIASESRAAVAGGITSYMEMPNCTPPTTNAAALEDKYTIAGSRSLANHAFYMGATNNNLEDIKSLDPNLACGVKIFMGASTGNMLVNDPDILERIFAHSPVVIATHCEDTPTITANEAHYRQQYGDAIPIDLHPTIRSEEACYLSSSLAVQLAKKHKAQLHVLHLTTERELSLFTAGPMADKSITLEACVHHLFFSEEDYATRGAFIKCNPAIKQRSDRDALLAAVNADVIDIIATDHAPHTLAEKSTQNYFQMPSGMPLVQHALLSLLEHYHKKVFSLETIVKKTAHNVADRFAVKERGYIREGYFADLVLVDLNTPVKVADDNILYHCGWSPFEGYQFKSSINVTMVNGAVKWQDGKIVDDQPGVRLAFDR